jgi:photosystem II stability/assembly factor-like uncharacterized protein
MPLVPMRAPLRHRAPWVAVALAVGIASVAAADDTIKIDSETFGGLEARNIGPATMSGRIAALDAVEVEGRLRIYVGSAGGGVWKSNDGGTTFDPVFDKHCQSIGAVAIDRSHPKTVWVGSGESWTRNSVSIGDGIYKTSDGGDNWQKVGLEESERIARIAIDPEHPDTVYVAVPGHLWNRHPMRGVYRTRDGGKTWQRVLFVNEDTGCGDVAVDPENPRIVYAGMWQFRRQPWSFSSGGPGSGLYKSQDGGDTWQKVTRGLPAGDLGRIGIAIAPSDPKTVYATVEAKRGGLYRSQDRGETWEEMNSTNNVTIRPFYFGIVIVDPHDPNRVYKPGIDLVTSDDGGHTFSGIGAQGGVHSDYHAVWIDPKNSERLLVGTDGGVYASENRGNDWRLLGTLPVGQFYHVSYDMEEPYNVYGGLQDNGSWMGPSQRRGGIANRHWRVLAGGDGMWAFVDARDPDFTYVEYQEGNVSRVAKSTGETKDIRPFHQADEPDYRFNWNTPIHLSPTRPGVMYIGAQFLFRSTDRGEKWERISPDLTTNDASKLKQEASGGVTVDNSSAENYCTIYAISESPKNPDVIWVGTDDGNVQLTKDGGKSWTNVAKKVPGLPPGTGVSSLRASQHEPGTAYVTFDGHGVGDMAPHVYRVRDYGKTWESLGTADLRGYALVVCEDRVSPNLLSVGTERGLFLTLDGGKQWAQFKAGLPDVAVRDLVIQPREDDLLIATHGRGVWIVDDIRCLRGLTPAVLASDAAMLESRPAVMRIPTGEQRFDASEYVGRSLPEAAFITYYLKKRHMFGDLKLEVFDAKGQWLSSVPAGKRRGINRVAWPMRIKPPSVPPAANLVPNPYSFIGPRVPEGTYTVKLTRDKDTLSSTVTLVPDPREKHTAEDRALQQSTVRELYAMLETLTYVADAVVDARTQTDARLAKLGKDDPLAKKLGALSGKLDQLHKSLVATREGRITGEEQLREKLGVLYGAVNGYDGRPSESQLSARQVLGKQLDQARASFDALMSKDAAGLSAGLKTKSLEPIEGLTRDAWAKKRSGS